MLFGCLSLSRSYGSTPLESGSYIGKSLKTFVDSKSELTESNLFEKVTAFQPSQDPIPNFRLPKVPVWVHFTIDGDSHEEKQWFLEVGYNMLDHTTLYHFHEGVLLNKRNIGDRVPYSDRPISFRLPIFPIQLQPGLNTFFMKFDSAGPVRLPLKLFAESKLQDHMDRDTKLFSFGFGMVSMMIGYNFFLFLSLRSKSYLFYTIFGCSFMMYHLGMWGLGKTFLNLPDEFLIWFSNWGFLASSNAAIFMSIVFSITFLDLKKSAPKARKFFIGLNVIALLLFFWAIVGVSFHTLATLTNALGGISQLTLLGFGIRACLAGNRPAILYTAGFSFVTVTALIYASSNFGLIPAHQYTLYGMFLGWCAELLLLSMALADRVRFIEKKRVDEKNSYIAELKLKEQQTMHSYKQLAKIVYPHQVTKISQGASLEETMPIGTRDTVVLCFDIVKSTEILKMGKKSFVTKSITEISRHIFDSYQQTGPSALAYRVNEAGDGLICTIGFPFPLAINTCPELVAYKLARTFVEIFEGVRQSELPDYPALCSIGIAKGAVTAYYSQSGTRDYQMFGKGIVLATRYEQARKEIFPIVGQGHIITLREDVGSVIEQVPNAPKLSTISLEQHHLSIRDDLEQKTLYYVLMQAEPPFNSAAS
ncbi:MAG: hypothetical protein HRU19_20325 [Pseudobacteriovorax sp.]|nr:hypothetical protein [Pseudobacteriovorax sp.]